MKHLGSLLIIAIVIICLCFVLNTNVRENFSTQYDISAFNTAIQSYYEQETLPGQNGNQLLSWNDGDWYTYDNSGNKTRLSNNRIDDIINDLVYNKLRTGDSIPKIKENNEILSDANTAIIDKYREFLDNTIENYYSPDFYDRVQLGSDIDQTIKLMTAIKIFYSATGFIPQGSGVTPRTLNPYLNDLYTKSESSTTSASSGGEVNPFEDKFNETIDIINNNWNIIAHLIGEGNSQGTLQFRESETERLSDSKIIEAINTIANRLGTLDPSITLPNIELDYGGNSINDVININDAMMSDIDSIIGLINDNYIVPVSFLEEELAPKFQVGLSMDDAKKELFLAFMLFYHESFNTRINMYVTSSGGSDGGGEPGGQSCDTNKLNNLIDTLDAQGNKIDNIYSSLFPTTAST